MPWYMLSIDKSNGKIIHVAEVIDNNMPLSHKDTSVGNVFCIMRNLQNRPNIGDTFSLTYAEKRACDYTAEADPLFIAYQGQLNDTSSTQADIDAAKQAWLDKRNEIKQRYPKQ